jgi:phage baseplate assembly protein gpV
MDARAESSGDDAVPEVPEQSVVLISAGASHSVALLCKSHPPHPLCTPAHRVSGWSDGSSCL